jgi:hypothetical protein
MVSSSSSSSSCVCCSSMCAVFSALAFSRASSFALSSWSVMFEGSGAREISLPSTWWCSSCSVSAGMFLFDLFYGGIVSYFLAETRWTPMLGGYLKIRIRSPNAREKYMQMFKSEAQMTQGETKNLLKTAHASKVVNPFTRALAPPFIGRRRDFYILKVPSNLRNIPNVNMYINVFLHPIHLQVCH